jgi:uncharacterized protein YegP (UPF0339 family)
MATAIKKSRAAKQPEHGGTNVRQPASMEFFVSEDNGGSYHWTIVASDGVTLARSEGFASYEDAELAGRRVRDGAASAPFEPPTRGARPVNLTARRNATRAGSDAERWLDEGGS